jgi:thioredoxin reductase (NADPH)
VRLIVWSKDLAEGMSQYLVDEIEANPGITVELDTEVAGGGGDSWLQELRLRRRSTGEEETVAADALFVMIGAEPRTSWLPDEVARDERGFVLAGSDVVASGRWPLERAPFPYETSLPGFFAVGDVHHASVKRVASAVGEGAMAVHLVHRYLAMT